MVSTMEQKWRLFKVLRVFLRWYGRRQQEVEGRLDGEGEFGWVWGEVRGASFTKVRLRRFAVLQLSANRRRGWTNHSRRWAAGEGSFWVM